ncbi:major facilitator superfamily domain-containing protein [Pseudomassariella vexata]|uniref:Major facilitator superfamily domain-containing protein n=1 Tax=Pseudomassariella vexata TaxID=1141098 RepID=A0A1Y2DPT6_9PEZI|nr:major facilitator superfamily domain-containing protein [Pseudomassariella vexata]ORY61270.1 major facilitator superfamily domain-containing protein [Pseudomassariella vexata]
MFSPKLVVDDDDTDRSSCRSSTPPTKSSPRSSICFEKPPYEKPPGQYHVFSLGKKRRCIYIISLAGLFSPLSSNIYFPAIGAISRDLDVKVSLIALTITIYMVIQGISPSFWGPLSDTRGRRLTFIGTFAIFLISNIGLALTENFATLMVFRGIQAAGSAATISVGSGVIGDISSPKERGGFVGIHGGLRQTGQSIGPVFGGLITHVLGFRAIFWVLFVMGSITLLLIISFLPETLRSIAGDGTVRLHGIHKPLLYTLKGQPFVVDDQEVPSQPKLTLSSVVAPFCFLFEKDIFVTLFYGAIVYTVHSMVTSSTTAMLQPHFKLTDLQVGLVFLPNGAGVILGSFFTGLLMDRDFRLYERRYRAKRHIPAETKTSKYQDDFPIEHTRLRQCGWIVALFVVATGLYGYSLALNNLVAPLVLQFLIAYTATAVFTSNSALILDLYTGAAASATAVNNLVRCSIGAGGVACVQFIVDAIGAGPTYIGCAVLAAAFSPLLVLEWKFGGQWRVERTKKLANKGDKGRQVV